MKKILSLISLAVYLLGSSYIAHANAMNLPFSDIQKKNSIVMETSCEMTHGDVKEDTTQQVSDSCFQQCLGQYGVVSAIQGLSLKELQYQNCLPIVATVFALDDMQHSYYAFMHHAPPNRIVPIVHKGYVGRTTKLLI